MGIAHGRGLFRRRAQRAPRAPGRRGGADRPAAGARAAICDGDDDPRRRPGAPARRRSIPATASCPRTPTSPRPAPAPASSSSARRPRPSARWASKSAAKALMAKAGVPLVPGYHGDDQDPAFLAGAGRRDIGYPGADQGQRRRRRQGHAPRRQGRRTSPPRWPRASARRRPPSATTHVLVEKYVARPRHIEVQVFADSHGNVRATCSSATARCSAATRR